MTNLMFNEHIKHQYLTLKVNDSYNFCQSVFNKCFKYEMILNKDVFDFNVKEIKRLSFSQKELLVLEDYQNWIIDQGFKSNNVNTVSFLIDEDGDEGMVVRL